MSISSLARKLQFKADQSLLLLDAPAGFAARLEPLPAGMAVTDATEPAGVNGRFDAILLFAPDSAALARRWPAAQAALLPDGLLWIAYPKKSSGVPTDLSRDEGWRPVAGAGWRGVRQVAVDDTWSALRFRPVEHASEARAIDAQYTGGKAALRPIYERLMAAGRALGDDVTVSVRQSYVALARDQQFAVFQPSTQTRLDLGLKLKEWPYTDRLVAAKGVGGGAITHRVALARPEDVDETVLGWLQAAYEAAG